MVESSVSGYAGRLLRVDLTGGRMSDVVFQEPVLRKWVGGAGLGAKILYDEVPPKVQWDDPENRLIMASGPLGGTRVAGSGQICVVTLGPMTGGGTSSQANGFMGAYMKFAGYDGVILQGISDSWVYLYLHDGIAELRDASHLLGLDSYQTQDAIAEELGAKPKGISVFGIGPAGERLVRFAAILGDHGHAAGHNGTGAVMGSKRVKAVVAARGPRGFPIADEAAFAEANRHIVQELMANPGARSMTQWGTSDHYMAYEKQGLLPVKNCTTNLFPHTEPFMGESYRPRFNAKPSPCWACDSKHIHILTIPEGPYKGFVGEEPEYEQWAAWGGLIGNPDVAGAVVLANEVDRLGLENNESGWLMGWVMECYEKGILTKEDTGGLEMTWGNVEATRAMLRKVAYREGIGDLLAEGVKRASERLGRGSGELAVYTGKGNSPRGHDHRGRWIEILDTCVSDLGTISVGPPSGQAEQGAPEPFNGFDWEQVAEVAGKHSGRMVFDDCLGVCRFRIRSTVVPTAEAVSALTGWDFSPEEAIRVGRRTINLFRAFNLKRGITPALEHPSVRYGSTPVDGPTKGLAISEHWERMRAEYYRLLGWDMESGRPLPATLESLELPEVAAELWG